MQRYVELGPSPAEEPCAQLGADDYYERSESETRRYIRLLKKLFPKIPEGCRFGRKSFSHDFGTYVEVVCYYDDEDPIQVKFAFGVEGKLPGKWPPCDHSAIRIAATSITVALGSKCPECGTSYAPYADA